MTACSASLVWVLHFLLVSIATCCLTSLPSILPWVYCPVGAGTKVVQHGLLTALWVALQGVAGVRCGVAGGAAGARTPQRLAEAVAGDNSRGRPRNKDCRGHASWASPACRCAVLMSTS